MRVVKIARIVIPKTVANARRSIYNLKMDAKSHVLSERLVINLRENARVAVP
jgi:hypothetical protein